MVQLLRWVSLVATAVAAVRNGVRAGVKNIAVIGAGAAGTSTAFHLQKFAEEEGIVINITVFEKTDRVGGRTLTVNAFNNPEERVELGASIFVTDNHILYNATQMFNLTLGGLRSPDFDASDFTAIWDGEKIVFQSTMGTSWWWQAFQLWWEYGMSPYRAIQLVKGAVGTFLRLYEAPYFPFRSLTQRVFELGLLPLTGVTGEQYLEEHSINKAFARNIIQPAARVNYASNLGYIHGLEAMVSFATNGAVAVDGGNWQIFEKMMQHSGAALYSNTSVASIALQKTKAGNKVSHPKYVLTTKNASHDTEIKVATAFDNVVIASPWQFSNIKAGQDVVKHRIDEVPYMKLHVTLFTSPFKLHAPFFNLEAGAKAPNNVYTTLGLEEEVGQGPEGVGRAGFYSISTLRTVTNPKTGAKEYLYKIFTAAPVTSGWLSKVLGTEVPSTFVGAASGVEPISWYCPHWFYSYPIELPRVTFQDPIVGRGLYYTSGIESFISTMETSALMGMNVARLISDDFAGVTRGRRAGQPEVKTRRREDFWDSMDNEMWSSMDFLGADEL